MTEAPTEPRPLLDMSKYASNEQKMLAALVQIAADLREIKESLAKPALEASEAELPPLSASMQVRVPPKGKRR